MLRVNEGNADRASRDADETQGITKFSDLTPAEFKSQFLTMIPRTEAQIEATPMFDETACPACKLFPDHGTLNATDLDWVAKGAVTKVKDQGQCGSCWAFGTTGDIEGTTFLKTGALNPLSEEQLVSCDTKSDEGCNGGLQEDAFKYVIKNGLTGESDYPYKAGKGKSGKCKKAEIKAPLTYIKSWSQVSKTKAGENGIHAALDKNGPVTLGIDASPMQDYKGGIDEPKNCNEKKGCGCKKTSLDHAVLFVGYGVGEAKKSGADTKYWKIKNSWASDWGEKGYYRVIAGENMCGLALDVVHSAA